MRHIVTPEQVVRFYQVMKTNGGLHHEQVEEALNDLINALPESTLGKLRPIAEMPETVPEGCVRMFVYRHASGCLGGPFFIHSTGERFNFFSDIQLPTPDPEAEERQRFEEMFNVGQKLYLWGPKAPVWTGSRYELDLHENVWLGWKLAKAK